MSDPDWLKEHKRLYPADSTKRTPQSPKPRSAVDLSTIRVSAEADALILDLEGAYLRMYAADPKDTAAVQEAYSNLSARRRDLYLHIARLEPQTGAISRRF